MSSAPQQPGLARDVGLREATALNIIDMIGVGPFVTIPLIIHAMHGPQAMLGWVLGALLAMCDGLVWAELGASMPQAGGSYQYLKESYGAKRLGRLDVIPVCVAVDFQCAALHRLRMPGHCALRGVCLAGAEPCVCRSYSVPRPGLSWRT